MPSATSGLLRQDRLRLLLPADEIGVGRRAWPARTRPRSRVSFSVSSATLDCRFAWFASCVARISASSFSAVFSASLRAVDQALVLGLEGEVAQQHLLHHDAVVPEAVRQELGGVVGRGKALAGVVEVLGVEQVEDVADVGPRHADAPGSPGRRRCSEPRTSTPGPPGWGRSASGPSRRSRCRCRPGS